MLDTTRRMTNRSWAWAAGAPLALLLALAGFTACGAMAADAEKPNDPGKLMAEPPKPAETAKPGPEPIIPAPLKELGRKNKVHLVYFVPKDRKPTANWREKITVLMTFVNDLYVRDLTSKGYETRGLDFEFQDGKPLVHLVDGKETATDYNGDPKFDSDRQWSRIIPEVEAAFGKAADNLYVIFVETYTEGPWKFEFPGGLALGARYSSNGGVGMFSAWVLRDEFCASTVEGQLKLLADETPIEGRTALHVMRPNSPRFEFIEDGFGAVAHELGHAFGLTHDSRADHVNIMGNGFRWLRNNYIPAKAQGPRVGFVMEDARLLAWSRFIAEDADLSDTQAPVAVIEHPSKLKVGATTLYLSGTIKDDKGLAGILFFAPKLDWILGGSDLRGREVRLSQPLIVPPLKAGTFEIVVNIFDRGGNLGSAKVKIEVE